MRNLITCILIVITFNHLQTQQKPNFTGTFTIDKSRTRFGNLPEYVLAVSLKIVHDGNNLTITHNTISKEGVLRSFTEIIKLGGDSVKSIIPDGLHRTAVASWNDGYDSIIIKSDSRTADHTAGMQLTETWSLIDGGKTLYVNRDVLQADGMAYSIKAFYEKSN